MHGESGNEERMYRRLRVSPEASAEQIRRAYRQLAHDVHPDANPEDPDASRRFQEITEAYEILSRPERRARYDQVRRQPARPIQTDRDVSAAPRSPGRTGRVAGGGPTLIGGGPLPVDSAPLVAGPVRVSPSGSAPVHLEPDIGGELSRLMEAIWSWWRLY